MPEVSPILSLLSDVPSTTISPTLIGYARLNENVTNGKPDNHEGIDFYRPVERPDKSKPLWGENQWPDIPGFREKYEAWVEKMKKLGMIVMEAYVFLPTRIIHCHMTYRLARYHVGCPSAWACPARNGQISVLRSTIAFGLCVSSVGRDHTPSVHLVDGVANSGYPPLPNDHEGYSCGAHRSGILRATILLAEIAHSHHF